MNEQNQKKKKKYIEFTAIHASKTPSVSRRRFQLTCEMIGKLRLVSTCIVDDGE